MKQRNQHNSIYTKTHEEWVKLRCESTSNNTAIARQFIKDFGLEDDGIELDSVRKYISSIRKKHQQKAEKYQFKRLFADIETGYYKAPVFGCFKQYIRPEALEGEKKIICISYKWAHEDKVHTLKWKKINGEWSDKEVIKKFVKILGEADEIWGHNWDKFDEKEIRTRALLNGVLMYPKYRTGDTLKKSRKFFRFPSNKLDFLGDKCEIGRKKKHAGFDLWRRCQEGYSKDNPELNAQKTQKQIEKEALKEMVEYCEQDVIILEDYFNVIMPYTDHNTNFAVLKGGEKWQCPECGGKDVELSHTDTTPMGYIKRHMRCKCKKTYHISNKSYQLFLQRQIN